MGKKICTILSLLILFASCRQSGSEQAAIDPPVVQEQKPVTTAPLPEASEKPADTIAPAADTAGEKRIRDFLMSTAGTFGWETKADEISFDFFPDGRLHIQGPDGEATMWAGRWKLLGDKLTLDRADLGRTETHTVRIDGKKLMLDSKAYTRYVPYRD